MRRRTALALAIAALCLVSATSSSAAPRPGSTLWARFDGYARFTAMDASSDESTVFVSGEGKFQRSIETVAYSASTGQLLWAASFQSGSQAFVTDVAADPSGTTLYVIGYVIADVQGDDVNWVVLAYDVSTGVERWRREYNGPASRPSFDEPTGVGVSPDSSLVFVTGSTQTGPTYNAARTVAYRTADGATAWVARTPRSTPVALAVAPDGTSIYTSAEHFDGLGHAVVTSYAADTGAERWRASWTGPPKAGAYPVALLVSPDGSSVFADSNVASKRGNIAYGAVAYRASDGRKLWGRMRRTVPGHGGCFSSAAAIDGAGQLLFLTGYGIAQHKSADYLTIAMDTRTGRIAWSRSAGSGDGSDAGRSIDVDPTGQTVYVSGESHNNNNIEALTLAYDTRTGSLTWKRYDKLNRDGVALAALHDEVIVTGSDVVGRTIAYVP